MLDGTVADGLGGVVTTEVGVGTGGISGDCVGPGEPDGTTTVGGAVLGGVLSAGESGRSGSADSTATGFGGRGDQSSTDVVAGVVAFFGAAPMPPAPPGALTGGGAGVGVPRVQPTVTAKGRPRATTLRKVDLGVNRTSSSPDRAPEKLRRSRIHTGGPAVRPLDQPTAGPVLSIGSHQNANTFPRGEK